MAGALHPPGTCPVKRRVRVDRLVGWGEPEAGLPVSPKEPHR